MLTLPNGHQFDFCCASGALGFDGDGHWWDQLARWLGLLDPSQFTIIFKTLTLEARKGNYNPWMPWRCVHLIPGGAVNAMGLPNVGYWAWIERCYPKIVKRGYSGIVSIQPTSAYEAEEMAVALDLSHLKGIEVNLSCPNVKDGYDPVEVIQAVRENTSLPVIAKLAYSDVFTSLMQRLDAYVDAWDLINSIPWNELYPNEPSPLAPYGLVGGISGRQIVMHSRHALSVTRARMSPGGDLGEKPIISGGGIASLSEVFVRKGLGASAYSLGTVFLRNVLTPWVPNSIVRQYRGTPWATEQTAAR
jgi:dihydroorotate dehydrogenase (NAD+) catalytic subunit